MQFGLYETCEVHEVSVPDEALVYEDEDILNYDVENPALQKAEME